MFNCGSSETGNTRCLGRGREGEGGRKILFPMSCTGPHSATDGECISGVGQSDLLAEGTQCSRYT